MYNVMYNIGVSPIELTSTLLNIVGASPLTVLFFLCAGVGAMKL